MSVTAIVPPAARPRKRSIEARRTARAAKAERERLVIDSLNRGVSVAEIAARIGVTEKRMRAIVREILARRRPEGPEDFAALQVSRLNEALLVAYGAMSAENLRAVGLVVRIVRELDRYHGFFPAAQRAPLNVRDGEAAVDEPPALLASRSQTASQALENAQNAPENGRTGNEDEVARPRLGGAGPDAKAPDAPPVGGQTEPQAPEMAQSAPENDEPTPGETVAVLSGPASAPDAQEIVRPQTAPQALEEARFAPGYGAPPYAPVEPLGSPLAASAEALSAHGTHSNERTELSPCTGLDALFQSPPEPFDPHGFRLVNIRVAPNGVYAG